MVTHADFHAKGKVTDVVWPVHIMLKCCDCPGRICSIGMT